MLVKPSAPAAATSNRWNGDGGASSDSSSESPNETRAAFSTSVVGAFLLPLDPRVGRFVAPHLRASSPVSALSPELRARRRAPPVRLFRRRPHREIFDTRRRRPRRSSRASPRHARRRTRRWRGVVFAEMSLRGECRFRVGTWELVRGPAESRIFSTAFPGRPDDTDAGRLRREGHSGRPRHRRCHARTHLHVNCGGLRCARVRLKGTGQSGCLLIPARISRARSSLRVAFREAWPFRFARVASCAYGRGRRARSRECSTHLSCSAIAGVLVRVRVSDAPRAMGWASERPR